MDFIIEDNIIKAAKKSLNLEYNTGKVIFDTLNKKPDHVAQIEDKSAKFTTFSQMNDCSTRCALWMKKQGIKTSDIVVICTHNHIDTYIPVFATFYVGAVYNAWSHDINLDIARYLMKLFTPKFIFTCESAVDVLTEAAKLEKVDTKFIVFGNHSELQSLSSIMELQTCKEVEYFVPRDIENPKQLAAIILTSGSTGVPKGAMFSHEGLLNNFYSDTYRMNEVVMMWFGTLYWLSGFGWVLNGLFNHVKRIIPETTHIEDTLKMIERYKINIIFLSPIMLTYLAKSDVIKKYDLSSLKQVIVGGGKPNKELMQTLQRNIPNAAVIQGHGMTEMGRCTIYQNANRKGIESAGFIVVNTDMKISDLITGEALGPNQSGELCLQSPSMMLGYYTNPEATKRAIDEKGWLHTGDLAYYDEDGEIFILDRISEMIMYKDHQISPVEIEQALMDNPAVLEVAVIPLHHEVDGAWPMAFVKKIPGSNVTEKELIALSAALGEDKILRGGVVFMDDLPKTAAVKIARNELKEIAKNLVKK